MSFPMIKNATGFSVLVNGESYNVRDDHPHLDKLITAIKTENVTLFENNINIQTAFKNAATKLGITFENGVVTLNGKELHNVLVDRIIDFQRKGLPFEPLLKFLDNLMQNPSARAIEELYPFLENEALPITEDGCFLAYKTVSSDWYSKTAGSLTLVKGKADSSGRIYNGVGEEIECLRNEVDDVNTRTCSKGLHVGALAYAGPGGFFHSNGDRVVIVKVNPRDAVSVPADHNAQKLRVCAYTVVQEYVGKLNQPLYNYKVEPVDTDFAFDEEDYSETESVEWERINPSSVSVGDVISFEYNDESRLVKVLQCSGGTIRTQSVYLGEFNDSWDDYEELESYRTFVLSKMSAVYRAN